MNIKVTNSIKIVIEVIAIIITLGTVLYSFVSNNCTLAILIILVICFFTSLLRINKEKNWDIS